jgi:hypothetical protein
LKNLSCRAESPVKLADPKLGHHNYANTHRNPGLHVFGSATLLPPARKRSNR